MTSFSPPQPCPEVWRVSQRHLELLEQCPRRYEREVIEKYALPPAGLNQQALEAGKRFHHLLQQRSLGIHAPTIDDPKLQHWLDHLESRAPELLPHWEEAATATPHHPARSFYQAEHERTWLVPTWRSPQFELTVRYDALIATPSQAIIIDWKTYAYPRPDRLKQLQHAWQTRLYCYVLAQTSHYAPAQISMLYWFAASSPNQPDRLTLTYNAGKFQQDQHDLNQHLCRLHEYLNHDRAASPSPQSLDAKKTAKSYLNSHLNQDFSTFPSQIQLTGTCSQPECPCTIKTLYPAPPSPQTPGNSSNVDVDLKIKLRDDLPKNPEQAIGATPANALEQNWDLDSIPETTWIFPNTPEN